MTFKAAMKHYRDNVLLDDAYFGQDVTHNPLGNTGSRTTVKAAFVPTFAPERDTETGLEIVHRGVLKVSAALTLDERDTWKIDGNTWATVAIPDERFGEIVDVQIQRYEIHGTKRTRATRDEADG